MNFAAGFDVFAHQRAEDGFALGQVFELDREQGAALGVHGGLPELFRVHFAQTLVARLVVSPAAGLLDVFKEIARVGFFDHFSLDRFFPGDWLRRLLLARVFGFSR